MLPPDFSSAASTIFIVAPCDSNLAKSSLATTFAVLLLLLLLLLLLGLAAALTVWAFESSMAFSGSTFSLASLPVVRVLRSVDVADPELAVCVSVFEAIDLARILRTSLNTDLASCLGSLAASVARP